MVRGIIEKKPDLSVLSAGWIPPSLVCRESKVETARKLIREGALAVIGPSGVGKTTLARMAFPDAIIVDCTLRRRAQSIARYIALSMGIKARRFGDALNAIREAEARLVVLDDFTLAFRNREMRLLLRALEKHLVVFIAHPSIRYELFEYSILEMPPYSAAELYRILEPRAASGRLPVEEGALWEIARLVGWPKGPGSARLALYVLRLCLERTVGEVSAGLVARLARKELFHVLNFP